MTNGWAIVLGLVTGAAIAVFLILVWGLMAAAKSADQNAARQWADYQKRTGTQPSHVKIKGQETDK